MTRPRPRLFVRLLLAACGVFLLAAALAWCGLTTRPAGAPPATRDLVIERGATRDDIVTALERAGLAPYPFLTRLAFRASGTFNRMRPGHYLVPADAHTLDLIDYFDSKHSAEHVVLRIVPGKSLWEQARVFEELGLADPGEVLSLANDRDFLAGLGVPLSTAPPPGSVPITAPDPDRPPTFLLEGYLFPDTWHVGVRTTARDAIGRSVRAFRAVWDTLITEHATSLAAIRREFGLSDHQLVILASLVQKEMVQADEAPLIAGVFYNRLREGWRLETDPTLMYREDRVGRPPTPEERRDRTNTYNTYVYKGLPPGPIANPGRAALAAVMNPKPSDHMFFVARRDGTGRHAFARDLATHRANIDRYLRKAVPSGVEP